jgi:hypothetical protein
MFGPRLFEDIDRRPKDSPFGPRLFEDYDRWPQDRPVVRVNWFRVGLALLLPALLVALVAFSDHRIHVQVVWGGPSAPTEVSSSTLQLVAEPVSQRTDSRSPLVPLGISVRGPSDLTSAATVEIIGLPRGWVLSAGRPLGDRWRIPVAQLFGVVILPPKGFSGEVDIAAELRLADDTLVERQSLRLAMTIDAPERATEKRMAPELAIEKTLAPGLATEKTLAPGLATEKTLAPGLATEKTMITIFHLKRAEDLLAQGDISAARLILRRLAEAGNARAALLLGETYEGSADPATARTWYENAAKFGSDEARRRLDRLGSEKPRGDLPPG